MTNKVRIADCQAEDMVQVDYRPNGSWSSVGIICLKKIKPIAKGRVQIKYKQRYGGTTIRKIDLPADTLVTPYVEKTRAAPVVKAAPASKPVPAHPLLESSYLGALLGLEGIAVRPLIAEGMASISEEMDPEMLDILSRISKQGE